VAEALQPPTAHELLQRGRVEQTIEHDPLAGFASASSAPGKPRAPRVVSTTKSWKTRAESSSKVIA
jgi:hypothetical protein